MVAEAAMSRGALRNIVAEDNGLPAIGGIDLLPLRAFLLSR
jgi:hypothetical protein